MCRDRAVPPVIFQKQQNEKTREKVLEELIREMKQK
jgi:hypothetical protein